MPGRLRVLSRWGGLSDGRLLIVTLVFLLAWAPAVRAQDIRNPAEDLPGSYNRALASLQRGDYDRGLDVVRNVISYWGAKAGSTVGPIFGHFYYLQGLLLMGKEDFDGAIAAFRACHDDFPNTPPDPNEVREIPWMPNRFRVHALAQWGACLVVITRYEEAVQILEKALDESKQPGNKVPPELIGLNLGRAYLRSGAREKGREFLGRALDNPGASHFVKQAAFMILAEDWTPKESFEVVEPFLWQYADLLREDGKTVRWARNPVFSLLGDQAMAENDPVRALAWFALMYNPRELISYLEDLAGAQERRAKLDAVNGPRLEAEAARLRRQAADGKAQIPALQAAVAAAHYQLRNFPASLAAYKFIADHYPGYRERPAVVYNVVASSAQLFRWDYLVTYGHRFLDEFPKHELLPEVTRLMTESPFAIEDFAKSHEIAAGLQKRLTAGEEARDVPDFIAGASLYHLEQFAEAETELEAYLVNYPFGKRLEPVRYYLGSVKVNLYKWAEGATILEAFLKDYPASEMVSGALYQAGLCRYVLGDLVPAQAHAERLLKDHSACREVPATWNLLGDVLVARGDAEVEEMAQAYLKGRETADRPADDEVVAYSLWKLILLYDSVQDWPQVVQWFDEMVAEHRGSRHEIDALAGALPALIASGRGVEAERELQGHILRLAPEGPGRQLDELFETLVGLWQSREREQPGAAMAALRAFSGRGKGLSAFEAWVAVAEVELRETFAVGEDLAAERDRLYGDLGKLGKEALPNYGLIKMARHLVQKENPGQARELYGYLIDARPEQGHLDLALLEAAQLDAQSSEPVQLARAESGFRRVVEESENTTLQEPATLNLARLLHRRKEWEGAAEAWQRYLAQSQWMQARAEANYQFGQCQEKLGLDGEAIRTFAATYINYPGQLDWSTMAYLDTARLLKKRGQEGDALIVLVDMLKRLGHLDHPGIVEGRSLFRQWKAEWTAKQPIP